MFLKTDGLVVRQVNYKDNDQILTVLTKEHGLMTLKARGVRSRSSRLKGACQLLAYSEFTVFENRGFHTIDEANAIQMFPELRTDIELLSLASYFAQVAEVLSQEDMPNPELLSLTLNALYALCRRLCTPELVKAAFELRAACLGGYTPELSGCAVCGDPEPDRFDVRGGILCCASCSAGEGLRLPVSPGSLAAMRYLVSCDAKRLFSFRLEGRAVKELCDLAETYLQTQLERGFYTLDFYKSLLMS
ncbi:MAG: DNA repair protein RecO [Oscillospiraceae bacterium]|nr:DNA repair protein RecO [Oscillospiraceae bacterium]